MNDMAASGYIASVFSFLFFFRCCFETSIALMGFNGRKMPEIAFKNGSR